MDDPLNRKTVADMTDDELDAQLTIIRERRLKAFTVYSELMEAKRNAKVTALSKRLVRQLGVIEKTFKTIDKSIERLEDQLLKARVIRAEMEAN